MDSATTGIIGTAELQDLTTNTVNSTTTADVNQVIAAAAAAASVTAEEAANAVSKNRNRGYNFLQQKKLFMDTQKGFFLAIEFFVKKKRRK